MRTEARELTTEQTEQTEQTIPALDDVAGYEDGQDFVICDTKNPNAWIRSDETRPLSN
ncbi:hypothetical protein ACH9L7_10490 [Haloferax sp. S1W]|uniref:DUF7331 family protein n=1 Tax=Haloferax sp. S1W TaxID=3377110 RepID=UPI0037CBBF23